MNNKILVDGLDGIFDGICDKLVKNSTKEFNLKNDKLDNIEELFNVFEFNNLKIKNRFAFINLNDNFLFENGYPSDLFFEFYENISKSNVGLICTGGCYVAPFGKDLKDVSVIKEDEKSIELFKKLTKRMHTKGAKIFLTLKPIYGRADNKNRFINIFNYSASFNKNFYESKMPCVRLSDVKCSVMIDEFAKSAMLAKKSKFDGIFIDGSLFNLIGEFSSKEFNKRKLGYYLNVTDFSLKLIKKINNQVQNYNILYNFTFASLISIFFKKSAKSIHSLKNIASELKINEIFEFIIKLVGCGVDGFVFSFGTYENEFLSNFNQFEQEGLFFTFYESIKDAIINTKLKNKFNNNVVIIYNDNFNDIGKVSGLVQNNKIDMINITKQVYADNNYLNKIKTQNIINLCIKCSHCNNISQNYNSVECLINPNTFGKSLSKSVSRTNNNVAVIGAGLSGIICSNYLAERGFNIDVYEAGSSINKNGKVNEIFGYDELMKNYNSYIENVFAKNIKSKKINLFLNDKFVSNKTGIDNYSAIIVATGFHEKFLEVSGAVLKNVKSIYEVLSSKKTLANNNSIVILARSELSIKLAIYLLTQNKKISIIFNSFDILTTLNNANLTYYFYVLSKLRAKIFFNAVIRKIEEDFVELIINNKIKGDNYLAIALNVRSGKKYPYEGKVKSIDSDLFIYEPELYSNNKLYYDLVTNKFPGELYLIGNALQISTLDEDIKSAYYVAKNL